MTTEPNSDWQLIDLKTFEKLPRIMVGRMSRQRKALWALTPDKALVMTHDGYKCARSIKPEGSCTLASAAYYIAKSRGLISSTKHLADGRIVVAFYSKTSNGLKP